jgi:putative ABC transport system permease protein
MFGFGSRMLRMRPGSVAGIFVMIAMTATIAAAAGQFMATALGAPGAGRFAGADLVLRATPSVTVGHGDNAETVDVQRPALLPPTALGEVGAVPGVRSVVGDVSFPLTVIGRDGMPLPSTGGTPAAGHGWPSAALTPYRLQAGSPPRTAGDVVLDARLAQAGRLHPGDRVRIVSPGGAGTFTLTGIAGAGKAQEQRQSAVFLTEVRAEQLSGFGVGFNAIAMTTTDRMADSAIKARIAAAVGSQPQVLDHRHAAAADAGDPRALNRIELVALLASSGGIMLAIAVFVVAGTVTFAVEGRRRQIALLRAVGATPSQVRRRLLRETAFIGLLAGIAGCLAATLLFGPFTHALISVGVADAGFTVAPNWIPYAIAVAVGPVVGLLATFVAAHRALRVRPGEALVESALPQRRMGIVRTLLGLAALGGGLALVIVLSSQAIAFSTLAAFCFTIAVALLGPLVIGWPAKLVGRTMLAGGGAGFLAGSSLSARRFRVGAVGAAIALVVALAGTEVVSLATAQRATQRTTADRVHAAQVIVARAGGGLPPNMATAAARIPGARAAGIVSTDVYLLDGHLGNSGDSWNAAGLDPGASHGLLDLDVRSGSLNDVRGDDIAVSDVLAKRGATIGTVLHARMADATPQLLRVVAIYHRANGLGDIVLPHALALAHATAALDSAVFVTAGHDAGAQRDLDAIVNSVPSAALETRAAYLGDVTTQGEDQARAQWVVVALMILIAAMAAFNTGAMAASERRRELVLARLAGATRGQIMRALTLESLLTTLVGIAVGAAVVLASLAGAGDDPTGGRLVVPPGQGILVVGGAIVLGLLGTLVPAAVVGRARLTAFAGARE